MHIQYAPPFTFKKTFLDFGPAHTSWCYAFERYNGLLGSYYTNNKAIEPQIMQRFCQHRAIYSTSIPYTELSTLFPSSYQQEDNSKISCDFHYLHIMKKFLL